MDATTIATIIAGLIGAVGAIIAALVSRHSNKPDPINKSIQPPVSNKTLAPSSTRNKEIKLSNEKNLESTSASPLPKVEKRLKENSSFTLAEKSRKRRVIITDSQGVTTQLSVYGIVYNPYGTSNPWFFASRSGINILRGESCETIAWDKINSVEITDVSPTLKATIFLLNGTTISETELSKGTFWGETDWGSSLLIHLSKLKVIEFSE